MANALAGNQLVLDLAEQLASTLRDKLAAESAHKPAEGQAEVMQDSSVVAAEELGLLAQAVRTLAEVAHMAAEAAASMLGSPAVADSPVEHIAVAARILAALASTAAELLLANIPSGGMVAHNPQRMADHPTAFRDLRPVHLHRSQVGLLAERRLDHTVA
jgi:hypothetical protein